MLADLAMRRCCCRSNYFHYFAVEPDKISAVVVVVGESDAVGVVVE